MKLISDIDSFEQKMNKLNGRLITLNNEYLFLLRTTLLNDARNIDLITIDSGYILTFLRLFFDKKIDLITGYDFFMLAKKKSNRKIIIIGKELLNENKFLVLNNNIIKINAIFGSPKEIFDDLVMKYEYSIFNDSLIFLMLGAEKQENLAYLLQKKIKPNNTLIAGLGGTWEQIVDNKKVPDIYLKLKLSWLYRTFYFWDKSKPTKIFRSIMSFAYYPKFLKDLT
jgi:UDP-N-acetyl-D-mannosaminuronic acid transferase (WecB/TagA/CpsF family)